MEILDAVEGDWFPKILAIGNMAANPHDVRSHENFTCTE